MIVTWPLSSARYGGQVAERRKRMLVPHDLINSALDTHVAALRDGLLDVLAALVLLLVALCSLVHALIRVVSAGLGLLLWVVALLITFLYWLRAWAVARSTSSLHQFR
jgi:hypothetical protein